MRKITNIEEIQRIALQTAVEFDKICRNNSIPYFMLGGTMLGAVRHKGFIPWDDDMDFGIPRTYISKFVCACKKELPDYLKLVQPGDVEYGITMEVFKISNEKTIVFEEDLDESVKHMGIFIDIFPLDYSDNKWTCLSRNQTIVNLILNNSFAFRPMKNLNFKGRFLRGLLNILPSNSLLRLAHLLVKKEGNYISNYSGFWREKETVPKKAFFPAKLYEFENCSFYGVNDYDTYLRCLYKDYMTLPPIEKRHVHLSDCFYK